ncbi:MAG: hypothetical protein VB861_02430 [Planctomycetaceae bacterium]
MNRETQVGLALAILLIGIVGAAFLRKPTLNADQGTPKTNSTPIKDSRSESERPPRSLNSPRRADSVTETPRVTSNTPTADTSPAPQSTTTNIPTPPKPTPTASPEPQPKSDSSPTTPPTPQSVRVALGKREPPAPPLPSTRPPTTTSTRPKPQRAESPRPRIAPDPRQDRQAGTPAQSEDRDIDRAPSGLRFLPARHPLAGRRARRSNRSDKR